MIKKDCAITAYIHIFVSLGGKLWGNKPKLCKTTDNTEGSEDVHHSQTIIVTTRIWHSLVDSLPRYHNLHSVTPGDFSTNVTQKKSACFLLWACMTREGPVLLQKIQQATSLPTCCEIYTSTNVHIMNKCEPQQSHLPTGLTSQRLPASVYVTLHKISQCVSTGLSLRVLYSERDRASMFKTAKPIFNLRGTVTYLSSDSWSISFPRSETWLLVHAKLSHIMLYQFERRRYDVWNSSLDRMIALNAIMVTAKWINVTMGLLRYSTRLCWVSMMSQDGPDGSARDMEPNSAKNESTWSADLKDIVKLAGPAILQLSFQQAVIVCNQSFAGVLPSILASFHCVVSVVCTGCQLGKLYSGFD